MRQNHIDTRTLQLVGLPRLPPYHTTQAVTLSQLRQSPYVEQSLPGLGGDVFQIRERGVLEWNAAVDVFFRTGLDRATGCGGV